MAKKKKPESMLTRQRRLLREQRAKKAAAKKAQQASQKKLPGKGQTSAGSTRARFQRGMRRDALAKGQLENFGRALKKTLKQGAAQDKLNKAAKGTKGKTVRTAQGKGELVKRSTNKPTSQRVQRVNVKVDPPKQLKGSSPNQPKLKKAPPAKLKGSSTPKALPTGRTQPKGKPSARRAGAAAKAARAAQGTKSPTVRTGQPAGAANRFYGADRVAGAVRRAQTSTALRGAQGRGGVIGTAAMAALGIAAANGALGKKVQDSFNEFNSRTDKVLEPGFFSGNDNKGKPKKDKPVVTKRNRRGRPTETKKPAKKGLSNIPVKEGTGKGSPTDKKPTLKKPTFKPAGKVPAQTKSKPIPKATPKSKAYSKDARNKEYDRLRKAGKIKEAEALGRKIYQDTYGKKKKKKPTLQSRSQRAGWQGNRNY